MSILNFISSIFFIISLMLHSTCIEASVAPLKGLYQSLEKRAQNNPLIVYRALKFDDGNGIANYFLIENKKLKAQKMTVMLVATQHGDEPSGGHALLHFIQEIDEGKHNDLLETMKFIIYPFVNEYGYAKKQYVNEKGININRDYLVLLSPQARMIQKLLRTYNPDVLLDLHQFKQRRTDTLLNYGYMNPLDTQIDVANNPNVSQALISFSEKVILPELIDSITQKGLHAGRYVGPIDSPQTDLTYGTTSLHTLRNYSALFGTLSVLIENADYFRPNEKRPKEALNKNLSTASISLKAALAVLNKHQANILTLRKTLKAQKRKKVILETKLAAANKPSPLNLININTKKIEHFYPTLLNKVLIAKEEELPNAFVVTRNNRFFKQLMDRHQISYKQSFEKSLKGLGTIMRINYIKITPQKSKMHVIADVTKKQEKINIEEDFLIIDRNQPNFFLFPILFSPSSEDSIYQNKKFTFNIFQDQGLKSSWQYYPVVSLHFNVKPQDKPRT